VTSEGTAMDSDKVMAVKDWPELKSVKEVCSFLALATYYQL